MRIYYQVVICFSDVCCVLKFDFDAFGWLYVHHREKMNNDIVREKHVIMSLLTFCFSFSFIFVFPLNIICNHYWTRWDQWLS